ncbi:MAG: hypothetical protein HQK51_00140 [Oligoflexia bacterium]|nr:hypothetical protein [Oligoflexia bacterium]
MNMNRTTVFILYFFVLGLMLTQTSIVLTAEVDNFTQRYDKLNDSTLAINSLINKHLLKAVNETNTSNNFCNKDILFKKIYKELAYGIFWSKIEYLIEEDPHIDKRKIDLDASVYRGISFFQSIPIHIGKLDSIVKIGEHIVGIDKFAHFFAFGYDSYKVAFIDNKGVIEALKKSEDTEKGIYGLLGTGVYSYGDLVANYQGMLFWHEFVYDNSTFTQENSKTLIKCKDNKWVIVKNFDVRDYVDYGWDEGINCSKYWDKNFTGIVLSNISILEQENEDYNYMCPIDPWACEFLLKKYASEGEYLISPYCLQEVVRTNN